jgi:hypothetical protein
VPPPGAKRASAKARSTALTSVETSVPTMPGRNGGRLRAGSLPGHPATGGGRPLNWVRELALKGYTQALPALILIARGKFEVVYLDEKGRECTRYPTPNEMTNAAREIGNRCIGSKLELDAPSAPLILTVLVSEQEAARRAAQNGQP